MRTARKTEHQQKALRYLEQNGINTEINWDNPKKEDFRVFDKLIAAGLLVNKYGEKCAVYNEYGPNSHSITTPEGINRMYGA